MSTPLNVEEAVKERYSQGAQAREAELCCPVEYDTKYLEVLPQEIVERDYGCGDPSQYVQEGDTVLDLGSGTGKIAYIASQIVGASGKVFGVDMNDDMLELAEKYRQEVADKVGWSNVEFRKGRIQDLRLDLRRLETFLAENPVKTLEDLRTLEAFQTSIMQDEPLIADDSIDVILSNCVLNLVDSRFKKQLFQEMFRVLKRGGRVAISDIVSDEDIPLEMQNDPTLWSGCISGAFREDKFLEAFERAGFYGIQIEKRDELPWQTVQGIEFRSVTLTAYKGKQGPCKERNQAVIYKGPWRKVSDDDGHTYARGQRVAVCDKTFKIMTKAPYGEFMIPVEPRVEIPLEEAGDFDCSRDHLRHPRETKGQDYQKTEMASEGACGPEGCC